MLHALLSLVAGLSVSAGSVAGLPTDALPQKVGSLKITSSQPGWPTRASESGGSPPWVEFDGHRILFDTGLRPETVRQNARDLGIDLSSVTDVVLSHHHVDHIGGLLTLRRELSKKSPAAISRIHVAPGVFLSRRVPGSDEEANTSIALKATMEATRPGWATCSARTAPGSRRTSGSGSWPRWAESAQWWQRSGAPSMRATGSTRCHWRNRDRRGRRGLLPPRSRWFHAPGRD